MNNDYCTPQIDFDSPTYFPAAEFPEQFLLIASAIQKQTQAPFELIMITLLEAHATTFSAAFEVEGLNGRPIPLSLYTLAIAVSGEGKSSTQSAIFEPIMRYSMESDQQYAKDLDAWQTHRDMWEKELDLLTKKRAKIYSDGSDTQHIDDTIERHLAKKPCKPRMSRIVSSDATPAGLRNWLAGGKGVGLLQNSDAGQLLNGPLVKEASLLCDLWSGSAITIDRGNSCISIPAPRVTISLKVQPNFFRELLEKNGEAFRSSGLGGRFLTYMPESRIGRRTLGEQLTEDDKTVLSNFHCRLYEDLKKYYGENHPTRIIRLSHEARAYLRNIAGMVERDMAPGGRLSYMTEFATKFIEHSCRIAAILAIFEDHTAIALSLDQVRRAVTITDYFSRQYAFAHSPYQGPGRDISIANELLQFLCMRYQIGQQVVPRTTVLQGGPKSLRNKANLDRAVEFLINWNRIRLQSQPGRRANHIQIAYQSIWCEPIPMPLF